MEKRLYEKPRVINVEITMSATLLNRLDSHLKGMGETNRSAWVRAAIRSRLSREQGELRDEDEDVG